MLLISVFYYFSLWDRFLHDSVGVCVVDRHPGTERGRTRARTGGRRREGVEAEVTTSLPPCSVVAPKFADAAEERQFPLAARHAVPSDAPSLLDLGSSSSLSAGYRSSGGQSRGACVALSLFWIASSGICGRCRLHW